MMRPDVWTTRNETMEILKNHGFTSFDNGEKITGVKTGRKVSFRIFDGSEHPKALENQCVNVEEWLGRKGDSDDA